MNVLRTATRTLRPAAKTAQAMLRWRRLSFGEAPPIFGNSKPKSGSHLLLQVLAGFTRILPYAYVAADPVRTITRDGIRRSKERIAEDLRAIPPGVVGWGYVEASPENVALLCQPGRVNYFIYRDPRDLLVSQVYYATNMHEEHGMHAYYNSLPDFASRLSAAITGVDHNGLKMVSVRERYAAVFEWLAQPQVLCLRFEDFIHDRQAALNTMLDQVERTGYRIPTPRAECLRVLEDAIQPSKSRTFRSGKTGGWREHFADEHKRLFKDVAGDLLVQLGYEPNNDW